MVAAQEKNAIVIKQVKIASDVYSLYIQSKHVAHYATAGQFLIIYGKDASRLLPRPISICEINKEEEWVRIVYRVVGKGTEEFSHYQEGDRISILGPLGNGYTCKDNTALIIGGGIGIPPMLALAKKLNCEKHIVLGYQSELFLNKEFESCGQVYLATMEGTYGTKGTVIDAIKEHKIQADIIYACGPKPMLVAIKEYAHIHQIEAQISLEEHMACGIGACLSCVCKSTNRDPHTNVHHKRICKDGPVFDAREVEL